MAVTWDWVGAYGAGWFENYIVNQVRYIKNWTPINGVDPFPQGGDAYQIAVGKGVSVVTAGWSDSVTLAGGTIFNSGAILIDSSTAAGGSAGLTIQYTVGLTFNPNSNGTGSFPGAILMSDNSHNFIGHDGAATPALFINQDNVISGAGTINLVFSNGFDARGTGAVNATGQNALVIASATDYNNGTFEATNPNNYASTGGLYLSQVYIDQTASNSVDSGLAAGTPTGVIQAVGLHAHVELGSATSGATIYGGTLASSGGGVINSTNGILDGSRVDGHGVLAPVNITAGSTVAVNNNGNLTFLGTISNSGTVSLNTTTVNQGAHLTIIGGVTLKGGGAVKLSNLGWYATNTIDSPDSGGTLDNVDNTISGSGQFGGYRVVVTNEAAGVIMANVSNPLYVGAPVTNLGVLEANGGNLILNGNVTGAGRVVVANNGVVTANGNMNQNIVFQGANAGKVSLAQNNSGAISGFSIGDAITFSNAGYNAGEHVAWLSTASGVQSFALENGGNGILYTFNLKGRYSSSQFAITSDAGNASISVTRAPTPFADAHDFGGDAHSDILLRNGSGVTYLWTMNGASVTNGATTSVQVGTNWRIKGVADFNGDGMADILWAYNNASNASDPLNGVSYVSLQNGASSPGGGVVQQLSAAWQVAGTGDFNGDGMADVLYRNSTTGQAYLDIMNGSSVTWAASGFTSAQVTDPNWHIAAVADFNGDGAADVLWRYSNAANASDPLNGAMYEWQMNGTSVTSAGLLSQQAVAVWQVAGTGDFNGDGNADILLRNSASGQTYVEFMNGRTVTSGAPTQWQIDNSWAIASIGDYNGDGMSDILFQQNSTGNTYVWQMNGANVTSGAFTSSQAGTGWTAQNGVLIG